MADQSAPVKGSAYDLYFTLYKSDGSVIANPGTYTKKIIKDGGAIADITNAITEVDTSYGCLKVTLTAAEMNADAIWGQIKDDTSGCVPFTFVICPAAAVQSGDAYARLGAPTGASIAADIATRLATNSYAAPDNATIAAIAAAIAALNDLSANDAGEAVLDALLADHADAGSVGAAIAAAGSAGDPWASVLGEYEAETAGGLFAALVASAALIRLKTDTLGSATVTVQSPASAAGTVTVEQGDSYPVAHGRVGITFTVADPTHSLGLDSADCTVSLRLEDATWIAASVVSIAAGYTITFTPTVAETAALRLRQEYKLVAVYDATPDDVTTLARGTWVANRDIPAV